MTHPTPTQVGYCLQTIHHLAQVDAGAYALIERWVYLHAVIAAAISSAEQGAAYGTGQADIRTYGHGGDPVLGRLDDAAWPTHISDKERAWLRKLHAQATGRFGTLEAWLSGELDPWLKELEREAG